MLSIGTVVMGVSDIHRALAFWTRALDYAPRRDLSTEDDFVIIGPVSGTGALLALDTSTSPVEDIPRMHLDLYAGDAADQAAEVARLIALGATAVDWPLYPPDPDFVVLADTEGNRFCVIDTSHGT
jgi:catechol 2,3-dioxygenase-like lactoylglutathione lyase family enzyme